MQPGYTRAVPGSPLSSFHVSALTCSQHGLTRSLLLQARLGDANRNLAARVLYLTASLGAAMGPAFDKAGRPLLVAGTALLNDNKKQVHRLQQPCLSDNEGSACDVAVRVPLLLQLR